MPKWLHPEARKLLQSSDLNKADAIVAQDGSGKYKRITDALKDVPEKSEKRYVIYVKKGIYFENVRIEKKQWNVMMIGDGMNATIVSASLNVVDGTPTFSTATFGKSLFLSHSGLILLHGCVLTKI
jgi:pectin methylesterase-like acyl-CoA thioesterase